MKTSVLFFDWLPSLIACSSSRRLSACLACPALESERLESHCLYSKRVPRRYRKQDYRMRPDRWPADICRIMWQFHPPLPAWSRCADADHLRQACFFPKRTADNIRPDESLRLWGSATWAVSFHCLWSRNWTSQSAESLHCIAQSNTSFALIVP